MSTVPNQLAPMVPATEDPALEFPGPRDALDSGSVSELCADCRAIDMPSPAPVSRHASAWADLTVPDDASALVQDLDDYGF